MTLRLGLRLALAGGRAARLRLAVMALGVGIGVALLLLSLCAQAAIQGRAERSGWQSADGSTPPEADDPALFLSVTDYIGGEAGIRAYVAAMGPRPPVPPGLDRLPGPGEVAVSPALRELLATTPDDELGDRFPGRVVATIDDDGLAHPDQLVGLVGRSRDQLDDVRSQSLTVVRGFDSMPSGYAFFVVMRVILLAGAVLLLVPVVVFVVTATRVAAAQRDQRLAAIRLVGATRLQAATVAAVETGLAAVAGSGLGWVTYEVARRVLGGTVGFQGARFFAADVVVGPAGLLAVLVGMPVLAMLTTVVTLRRVEAGPLAAGRGPSSTRLSAWRVVPFAAAGAGQLSAVALDGVLEPDVTDSLTAPLALLTVVGLVVAGPWLCQLAGLALARTSRRVPGLVAARRVAGDPRATFRAVGGVVLAVFVVVYSAALVDPDGYPSGGSDPGRGQGVLRPGVVEVLHGTTPKERLEPLLADGAVATRVPLGGVGEVVASCDELARVVDRPCSDRQGDVHPAPGVELDELAIARIYVPTDGTAAAEDRVRVRAAAVAPNAIVHTQADRVDTDALWAVGLWQLTQVGWMFALVVAACSLTVGMVAGLIERRRPFALLRASGLRLGELRWVVFLETAVAMVATAAVGVGLGLASSWAMAVWRDIPWYWPQAGVFAMVAVGVAAALALTTLALPLLDLATRHDTVRYE